MDHIDKNNLAEKYSLNKMLTDTNLTKQKSKIKFLIFSLILIGLLYLSRISFSVFHSVIEFVAVIIAINTAGMAFNSHEININNKMVFLGIAYGFVGGFDFLHTLAYLGLGIFPEDGSNLATQLWIIARFIESMSLLLASIQFNKKLRFDTTFYIYTAVSAVFLIVVFYLDIFPTVYIPNVGLTTFKIVGEYIVIMILIASFFLIKKKKNITQNAYKYFLISIVATIISEIFFLNYVRMTDFTNVLGHMFKLISFYYIYKISFEISLKEPYFKLKESEDRYRNLINMVPVGICIHENGKILFSNPQFVKIVGEKNIEQVVDKYIFDYIPAKISETFTESTLISRSGSLIDIIVCSTHYPKYGDNAELVILRDITEQKQSEVLKKELEVKERLLLEAEKYDKIKTQFFASISHELKTPLNIILGGIQLLKRSEESNRDSIIKYINMMKQNCYRLLRLINNLIDVTKFESGYFKFNFKRGDMINVIENITLSVAEYANAKGIKLIFDTEIEEKIMSFDPENLERVMLNLLSNAIKFTNIGGEILVTIYDRDESLIISVKDDGEGIPKEMKDKIFERFTQVDSSVRRKAEGSGIGLSLVKFIIEAHSGKITVDSEYGKGSEFRIELPYMELTDQENYSLDEVSITSDSNVERLHIEFSDIYI